LNAKDKVIKDQIDQSHKEALLAVLDSELLADSRNLAQELAKYRAECKELHQKIAKILAHQKIQGLYD